MSVVKTLEKQNVLTPSLNETICNIKDLDELEFCVCKSNVVNNNHVHILNNCSVLNYSMPHLKMQRRRPWLPKQ